MLEEEVETQRHIEGYLQYVHHVLWGPKVPIKLSENILESPNKDVCWEKVVLGLEYKVSDSRIISKGRVKSTDISLKR